MGARAGPGLGPPPGRLHRPRLRAPATWRASFPSRPPSEGADGGLLRVALYPGARRRGRAALARRRQRRDPRAGGRLGLRPQRVRPRDAGAPPAGLGVQADHLRRGPREGLHRVFDPLRSARGLRRRDLGLRLATAELRQELLWADHAARGAGALGEQRHRPSVSRHRRRLRDLLRAEPRDPVAAPARPLARARLERAFAARAHARLRRVRLGRSPRGSELHPPRHGRERAGPARAGRAAGRAAPGAAPRVRRAHRRGGGGRRTARRRSRRSRPSRPTWRPICCAP